MRESISVLFLYRTIPGRMVLKLLVQPGVSKLAGAVLSTRISRYMIPYYVRKHKIDMDGIAVPEGGFPSFHAFFIRKRKDGGIPENLSGQLISPCDGFLTCAATEKDSVFRIKNTEFSLQDLLRDPKLAAKFQGGCALIFRLTPANYHRYCYAADGSAACTRKIPGKLHCVRPVALETLPVFVQNSREYQVIRTRDFGWMVQMEVGALMVGKIRNHAHFSTICRVRAGQEKGYFEFGGSTIVLLLQKGAIHLEKGLYRRINENGEIPVRMGECVARKENVGNIACKKNMGNDLRRIRGNTDGKNKNPARSMQKK